ncbi:MAG TPA: pitrilysin family protein [Patescibacteria group bacterium]|nr:pitrilysin family protein [Patescibacteria group bacterium]
MNYKLDKLPNGIRLITVEIPNMESATVTLWVGVGSRFEEDKIAGLSHFLEHMVFKGSKKRPTAKKISEAIDAFGGEFNASTSKEWTNFYIKARKEKVDVAFDVLSDMVLNPILSEKEIEKEKGVICEEISMYDDTPMAKIDDIYERLIFKGSRLGRDIIGTKETVRGVKRSDFDAYRKTHYKGSNFVVTVAGGIKRNEVLKLTNKYLSSMKDGKKVEEVLYKSQQKVPTVLLETKKNEQGHLILGFLGDKRDHKDKYAEAVLASVIGGGMSARMFTEVREKRGLAYAVRTGPEHFKETGYFGTYAGVDLKRIDDAIKVILDEHYKLSSKKKPISKKEFEKAKEFMKGHLALSLEDTKAINGFFGMKELLLEKIETPDEVIKKVDKVTLEEVYAYAQRIFKPERLSLAVIGPFDDEKRFMKLLH